MNDLTVAATEAYKTDGWARLVGEVTGLNGVLTRTKSILAGVSATVTALKNGEISWKDFFDPSGKSNTAYWKAFNENEQNSHAVQKSDNYWKEYGKRLSKQYGLDKKQNPVVTIKPSTNGFGSSGRNGGNSGRSSTVKKDLKKLADTVNDTNTELVKGTKIQLAP